MKTVYLIGSLENYAIQDLAGRLRERGFDVFDDWQGAGNRADKAFNNYRKKRGLSYRDALKSHNAKHIFSFDKTHLLRSDIVVLVMPAGKSGHLELGWATGKGKIGFVYFPDGEPERIDQMYQFCMDSGGDVVFNEKELFDELDRVNKIEHQSSLIGKLVPRQKAFDVV